jgi:hypothetical protein
VSHFTLRRLSKKCRSLSKNDIRAGSPCWRLAISAPTFCRRRLQLRRPPLIRLTAFAKSQRAVMSAVSGRLRDPRLA